MPAGNATFFCDNSAAYCYFLRTSKPVNFSTASNECGAFNGSLVSYDRAALQLEVEKYFRGGNPLGWDVLPASYWMGVSRIDEFDTWKLANGLETGQVSLVGVSCKPSPAAVRCMHSASAATAACLV